MKRFFMFLLLCGWLFAGCGPAPVQTPAPMPAHFEAVWPKIQECFAQTPDIEWDGAFVVADNSSVSSVDLQFDAEKKKMNSDNVEFNGSDL